MFSIKISESSSMDEMRRVYRSIVGLKFNSDDYDSLLRTLRNCIYSRHPIYFNSGYSDLNIVKQDMRLLEVRYGDIFEIYENVL